MTDDSGGATDDDFGGTADDNSGGATNDSGGATDDDSGGAIDDSGGATDDGPDEPAGDRRSDDGSGGVAADGPVARLAADAVAAGAAAVVGWAAVLLVAEALGGRPWRWPGGTVGGVLAALAVVGVPTFVARRRYGVLVPERWLHAGVAFLAGAVVASLALLGLVLASLLSGAFVLPRWLLSEPTTLVALAVGGAVGVGLYAAAERTGW